jgi:multidrug efflux system outer membrane protein
MTANLAIVNEEIFRSPRQSAAWGRWLTATLVSSMLLISCATQKKYQRPSVATPVRWANSAGSTASAIETTEGPNQDGPESSWWSRLADPAIDAAIESALADNPSLAQVAATIDEARATLRLNNAQRLPNVSAGGSAQRARTPNFQSVAGSSTLVEDNATLGPSASWQIDLWGRLKESSRAARDRLDARNADAREVRLALTAQIADAVMALRACGYSVTVRDRDITSREIELTLTRKRFQSGNLALVDEANAEADLENARTNLISQVEECTRDVDSLVALSGRDADSIRALVSEPLIDDTAPSGTSADRAPPPIIEVNPAALLPSPPAFEPDLPATVLLEHPSVVSAERELAARWSEIAVARAQRLPTVDLAAALSGNWLRAFGVGSRFETWSFGGALSLPLFDGGAGAANVSVSEARYREALADLRAALRTAAQNVEDSLAARLSAEQRIESSRRAVVAGHTTLQGKEASWKAGAISLFELEDARRQFNTAQESAIAAARDRAQAWINLYSAAAGHISAPPRAAMTSPANTEARSP